MAHAQSGALSNAIDDDNCHFAMNALMFPLATMDTHSADPFVDDGDVLSAVMSFLDEETGVDHELDELYAQFPPPPHFGSDSSGSPCHSDNESAADTSSVHSSNTPLTILAPSMLLESHASGTTNTTTNNSIRRPRQINRSRMRLRHEVLSLRQQAVALQSQLDAIWNDENKETEAERQARSMRVAAWKAVAKGQQDKLRDAERERNELRTQVKECRKSIRRVERFLSKQTVPKLFTRAEELLSFNLARFDMDPSDSFDDISCNLPAMYARVNELFTDPRLDTVVHGLRDIRITNEANVNLSVEALASRVLPFGVALTADAVWKFHQIKAAKPPATAEKQEQTSQDSIRRIFTATIDLPHYRGRARGRMETRRFREEDRVVIVQYAVFDQTERLGGKYPEAIGLREFNWTVIGPPRNERLRHSGRAVSQIATYEVNIPFRENRPTNPDSTMDLDEMKRFGLETVELVHELESQAVENILMNLALGR